MCESRDSYSLLVTTAAVLSESEIRTNTSKTCETNEAKFNSLFLAESAFKYLQSEIEKGSKIFLGVTKLY